MSASTLVRPNPSQLITTVATKTTTVNANGVVRSGAVLSQPDGPDIRRTLSMILICFTAILLDQRLVFHTGQTRFSTLPLRMNRPWGRQMSSKSTPVNRNASRKTSMSFGSRYCRNSVKAPSRNPPIAAAPRLPIPPTTTAMKPRRAGARPLVGVMPPVADTNRYPTIAAIAPLSMNATRMTELARTPISRAVSKSSEAALSR